MERLHRTRSLTKLYSDPFHVDRNVPLNRRAFDVRKNGNDNRSHFFNINNNNNSLSEESSGISSDDDTFPSVSTSSLHSAALLKEVSPRRQRRGNELSSSSSSRIGSRICDRTREDANTDRDAKAEYDADANVERDAKAEFDAETAVDRGAGVDADTNVDAERRRRIARNDSRVDASLDASIKVDSERRRKVDEDYSRVDASKDDEKISHRRKTRTRFASHDPRGTLRRIYSRQSPPPSIDRSSIRPSIDQSSVRSRRKKTKERKTKIAGVNVQAPPRTRIRKNVNNSNAVGGSDEYSTNSWLDEDDFVSNVSSTAWRVDNDDDGGDAISATMTSNSYAGQSGSRGSFSTGGWTIDEDGQSGSGFKASPVDSARWGRERVSKKNEQRKYSNAKKDRDYRENEDSERTQPEDIEDDSFNEDDWTSHSTLSKKTSAWRVSTEPSVKSPTKSSAMKSPTKFSLKSPTKSSVKSPNKSSVKSPTNSSVKSPNKSSVQSGTKSVTTSSATGEGRQASGAERFIDWTANDDDDDFDDKYDEGRDDNEEDAHSPWMITERAKMAESFGDSAKRSAPVHGRTLHQSAAAAADSYHNSDYTSAGSSPGFVDDGGSRSTSYEVSSRASSAANGRRSAARRSTQNDGRSTTIDRRSTIHDRRSTMDRRRVTVNERQSTTSDRRSSTNDRRSTTNDRRSTTNDRRSTTNDRRSTTNDRRSTTNDRRSTTNDRRSTTAAGNVQPAIGYEQRPSSRGGGRGAEGASERRRRGGGGGRGRGAGGGGSRRSMTSRPLASSTPGPGDYNLSGVGGFGAKQIQSHARSAPSPTFGIRYKGPILDMNPPPNYYQHQFHDGDRLLVKDCALWRSEPRLVVKIGENPERVAHHANVAT